MRMRISREKKLLNQKWIFILTVLLIYIIILIINIISINYCKKKYIINFINNDTLMCNVINYSFVFYNLLIIIIFVLVFFSALLVNNDIVKNPLNEYQYKKNKKKIMVFIPVYSESIESLYNTIDSVILNDYPIECKSLFIVVDGIVKGEGNDDYTSEYSKKILETNDSLNLSINNSYQLYIGVYRYIKYVLLIKKENMGKKDSFLNVYKTLYYNTIRDHPLKTNHKDELNYLDIGFHMYNHHIECKDYEYILMLDTDTIVEASSITKLSNYLDAHPFTTGVCGETSIINKNDNLLTMSQYYEYWITHYTLKSFESTFGDVLVLSGCFTLYRKDALMNKKMMERYELEDDSNIYNANISKLGEDRLFTNLLLQTYPELNTKYIQEAKCYTYVPTSFKTLCSQRRRWTNSMIFCNFMLLLNCPKYTFFKRFRFMCILLIELWITIILPICLLLGYYFAIRSIILLNVSIDFIITLMFLLFPLIQCILLFRLDMIIYSIVFILLLPLYGIYIPLYSIYNCNVVNWGHTRKIDDEISVII